MTFENRVYLITGGSRGIGLEIARRLAGEGASIAIAAKTVTPDPRLPGTIHSAVEEIRAVGGKALAVPTDLRDEMAIEAAVEEVVAEFGRLDGLINNASAIRLTGTLATPAKRFDLMTQVNVRGTFLATQAALPHLLRAPNPHVLTMSPPLTLDADHFKNHVAYSIAKYGMSLCTLGMAREFAGRVAINSLWPRSAIATAAVENEIGGTDMLRHCRKPAIVAEAAFHILR